jgi:hypothetical protein
MISYAFPDFDVATLPPIPSHWRDVSYKNDACPSWLVNELQVFIDYADPDAREVAGARFHVLDQPTGDALLSTDAWPDVLNFVHLAGVALPPVEPDQDEDALTRVYDQFLAVTGLPAQSADELIFHDIPWNVRAWLTRFIEAWEEMREDERDWMKYAEQKVGIK